MSTDIKTMQLYPRAARIYDDLRAIGLDKTAALPIDILNRFDQLHYHGIEALDAAINACKITSGAKVLEVGSGWGGCARYIANTSGAHVTAVELQDDYDTVARDLTQRAGLQNAVQHVNADFLALPLEPASFDHAVSWLALFHIPQRATYLDKLHAALRPKGTFFAEDLDLRQSPAPEDLGDFEQHLFPNSLVGEKIYRQGLADAGFDLLDLTDMTEDWTAFTAARLKEFHNNHAAYSAVHGVQGYETIEVFYSKMAGYFADDLVGGVRFLARRS